MARRPDPPKAVTPVDRAVLSEEQRALLHRTIGERVKAARNALGMTQAQLAAAFGRKSQAWVVEVESGRSAAQPYLLAALATATGRSVGWFFGEPDRGPAPTPPEDETPGKRGKGK